jgi:hypothetical protein
MSGTPQLSLPVRRIDLGLAPEVRYIELAREYADRMKHVVPLFDDILTSVSERPSFVRGARLAAKCLLRRLKDPEQNAEIRGISKAAEIPIHLLVALNSFLDLLLGCTSGCVVVNPGDRPGPIGLKRLMHFRTLDWDMDPLRELLVVLEFVDSSGANPTAVLARSITYVGFVGCLTGVRYAQSLLSVDVL